METNRVANGIGESTNPANLNSKQRFSNRVADYVKYRPDYPREILSVLAWRIGFAPDWKVADIGSGTGISSRMFLEHGNEVFGVEPNADMRLAAETEFASQSRFHSVAGSAEVTTLPDASMDLVIAAQAFHWFDKPAIAKEWRRILRPGQGGYVIVMWNQRLTGTDPFSIEYDELLHRFGTDYKEVAHRTPMTILEFDALFGVQFELLTRPNVQQFDLDGLLGRVRSSSYTPTPGQPGYSELFAGLADLFTRRQSGGTVQFNYQTELFIGRLKNDNC